MDTSLREHIIGRLHYHLSFSPGDSGRWAPANKFLSDKMGGEQRFGKKGLKTFDISKPTLEIEQAIKQLNDVELVTLFEIVLRRFSQQR